MSANRPAMREDGAIYEAILGLIAHYPPLQAEHGHLHVSVTGGIAILSGTLRGKITRRYLIEQVSRLEGVAAVDAQGLYDDETIRLEVGGLLSEGMIANVNSGVVSLSGEVPDAAAFDALAPQIALIPGVKRILSKS